jgi:hypothetical protein
MDPVQRSSVGGIGSRSIDSFSDCGPSHTPIIGLTASYGERYTIFACSVLARSLASYVTGSLELGPRGRYAKVRVEMSNGSLGAIELRRINDDGVVIIV